MCNVLKSGEYESPYRSISIRFELFCRESEVKSLDLPDSAAKGSNKGWRFQGPIDRLPGAKKNNRSSVQIHKTPSEQIRMKLL
jgi:hypothetical protein